MSRSLLERRLSKVAGRLKKLRQESVVLDEQYAQLASDADEARVRALVSETPLADQEYRLAQRHADAMARHRGELQALVVELERNQDELLDRLVESKR